MEAYWERNWTRLRLVLETDRMVRVQLVQQQEPTRNTAGVVLILVSSKARQNYYMA